MSRRDRHIDPSVPPADGARAPPGALRRRVHRTGPGMRVPDRPGRIGTLLAGYGQITTEQEGTAKGMTRKGFVEYINLPQIHDARGDLTFVEGGNHIPFEIRRVYYLYNVPVDSERGGHAHKELEQIVFALSGSFRMRVDDGRQSTDHWLRDPRKGLYISRLVWREMDSFSQGAVCMVLASHPYDESDYYRDYDTFRAAAGSAA